MIRPGEMLGHFRIQRRIGSGGMGTIFAALDTVLHRRVALKVIHERLVGKRGCLEAFKKEAATQAQLTHPNIVSLHAFQALNGHHAMVMEYVEGESLRDILRREGSLAAGVALNYTKQLLRGLHYAHSMQIVHLDIKPGNLIVTAMGRLKISDFGIAAIAGYHPNAGDGFVMATPWYASPEQLLGRPLDHRSDLFSAGITLYEMLTGEIPYDAEIWQPDDPRGWVAEIDNLPAPSEKKAAIPKQVDVFVRKAIRRQPERRFQHAGDMLRFLDGIETGALRT